MDKDTASRENRDFVMLYRDCFVNISNLAAQKPTAFRILWTIIEHMDGKNALCCSMVVLQELLNLSRQTVSVNIRYLKEHGYLTVLKSGTSNVYVVNPDIAWTSYANQKKYCKFEATVLLAHSEQEEKSEVLRKARTITGYSKTVDTSEFMRIMQSRFHKDEGDKTHD